MEILTEIQKEMFLRVSGMEFNFTELKGSFSTSYPYNNTENGNIHPGILLTLLKK